MTERASLARGFVGPCCLNHRVAEHQSYLEFLNRNRLDYEAEEKTV
jgi:hypothetical protein